MAINLTAFETTTLGQILQAYNEGDYLSDNPFQYVYEKGSRTKLFPKFTKRTAVNEDDDASDHAKPSSTTESSISVSTDKPLKIRDIVTYQQVNDYGGFIPKGWAERFGRDVGQARSDRIAAFVAKTALARSASAGKITEAASTTAANMVAAVGKAIARLQEYYVPTSGYVLLLKPESYQAYINSTQMADYYINKKKLDQEQDMVPYQGGIVRPAVSVMGLNWTNTTSFPGVPSAYQANFTNVWGILWQKEAIAMLESERAEENSRVVEIPAQEGWLVSTRMQFGLAATQPEGCVVLATS
jgi:hypothetical protein